MTEAALDHDSDPDDHVGGIVDPDIPIDFAPTEDEDGGDDDD